MRLLPNIGPLDSSFPLFGTPRLQVVARGDGAPRARDDTVLTIEVVNVSPSPTDVASVRVGYMYVNAISEAFFGKRAPQLTLHRLSGRSMVPVTLDVGESVAWTASLGQLATEAREGRFAPGPHSPYLDLNSLEADLERGVRPRRATLAFRNAVSAWTYRRLAVVLVDDRGTIYKAKVRWRPPGGAPLDPRVTPLGQT